jgi:hypothetical protein
VSAIRTIELSSLEELAFHFAEAQVEKGIALQEGLHRAAEAIVKIAKKEIGEYQKGVGPFLEWEQLAQSTEDDKERKGYPADAPLLRKGDLRDSYEAEADGMEAIAGSKDPVAFWQEVGTQHIPPREVLGPAAIRARKKIEKAMGAAYVESLLLQPGLARILSPDEDDVE